MCISSSRTPMGGRANLCVFESHVTSLRLNFLICFTKKAMALVFCEQLGKKDSILVLKFKLGTSKSPIHVQCHFLPYLTNLPLKLGNVKLGMKSTLTLLKHVGSTVLSDLHLLDHLNFTTNYKAGTIILTILQIRNGVMESSSNLPKICGISVFGAQLSGSAAPLLYHHRMNLIGTEIHIIS